METIIKIAEIKAYDVKSLDKIASAIENANADMGTDRNGFFISEVAALTDAILQVIEPKLTNR